MLFFNQRDTILLCFIIHKQQRFKVIISLNLKEVLQSYILYYFNTIAVKYFDMDVLL